MGAGSEGGRGFKLAILILRRGIPIPVDELTGELTGELAILGRSMLLPVRDRPVVGVVFALR